MRCRYLILAVSLVYFTAGCATLQRATGVGSVFIVNVDAVCANVATRGHSYLLWPGEKGLTPNDLLFREYAKYIEPILAKAGYTRVVSAEQADIIVIADYGIGSPRVSTSTTSLPIYDFVGGSTSHVTVNTMTPYGSSMTTGTITEMPTYQQVGTRQVTNTSVGYMRYVVLRAFAAYRLETDRTPIEVWRTTITSSGSSNDLRKVFPYMMIAAQRYVGKQTAHSEEVTLSGWDGRVRRLVDAAR
jgi:hypothetical protein